MRDFGDTMVNVILAMALTVCIVIATLALVWVSAKIGVFCTMAIIGVAYYIFNRLQKDEY